MRRRIKPLAYFKNLKQADVPNISLNPRVWYRGTAAFSCNVVPKTVIQILFNQKLANTFPEFSAPLAGVFSALLVCPTDSILIQQYITKKNLIQTIDHMSKNYGPCVFFRAFPSTAVRELSYTTALLNTAPKITADLKQRGYEDLNAELLAGGISGTLATTVSQVFDTRKTLIQTYLDLPMSNWKNLFNKQAFAGYLLRIAALSSNIYIINKVRNALTPQIHS
ncbi:MAG: hypothetical protein V4494_04630 [Chlamydiota bacterium]